MMRRYLLVLDMDLLAVDEQLGLEPISYLLARHEEQPSEVVVLSLADHRQARLPALELLLGTSSNITKFPVAPQPDHDIGAAAEHRMNLARRQPGTWLARALRRDPAHRLRPRLGQRLIVFPLSQGVPHPGSALPSEAMPPRAGRQARCVHRWHWLAGHRQGACRR